MGDTPSGVVEWVWPQVQILMPDCGKVFPGGSVVKDLPANTGDMGSIPGSGRSSGEGNGNPLQYSCQENSIEEPGGLQSMG